MQKLRAASKSAETLQPEEILESLLVDSGAAGVLPTSEKKLLNFLGLEQLSFDFNQELDFLGTPERPPGELRAVLHLAERVVATHSGLGEKRTRFSVFHEIGHCVLPEHVSKLFLDTDQTLSWWTKTRLEREANQFAADILFQGKLFSEQCLGPDTSLKTVIDIAPTFGASFEAAFRRYTESHVVPCGLIIFDKVSHGDESFVEEDEYRVQYTIGSPSFRKLFFTGVQLNGGTCKASEIYSPSGFLSLGQVVERELVVESQGKDKYRFETEIFSNGYKIFQFLRRPLTTNSGKS
jgi:hypothetical protein